METTANKQANHESSSDVTERTEEIHNDTYNSLVVGCAHAGISIARLCREADVDRSVLVRWKREEPKSIRTYLKLKETLERLKSSNQ